MSNFKKTGSSNRKEFDKSGSKRSSTGGKTSSKRRGFDKDDEKESRLPKGAAYNDPSWYVGSDAQAVAAANVSFGNPVGAIWDLAPNGIEPTTLDCFSGQCTPGLMAIRTAITPGVAIAGSDPINLAAQDVYSWVRHANAGHTNYDPQDLMIYLLAMDEMYSMYAWLKRAYGIARNYTAYNRYYPDSLLEAMNINPADFHANLASIHYYLLQLEGNLRKFNVPTGMPFFTRHQWMYSEIFVDAMNIKAQTYFYTPAMFRTYEETSGAGYLKANVIWAESRYTYADIRTIMDAMISKLVVSEDCGIISGDIAKAYSSLYAVPETPIDYQVLPTFNPEVLQQFHNATILTPWWRGMCSELGAPGMDITQNAASGLILFNPAVEANTLPARCAEILVGNRMLDMKMDVPDPKSVMVATRLMNTLKLADGSYSLASCGSEIAVDATIFNFSTATGVIKSTMYMYPGYVYAPVDIVTLRTAIAAINMYSAFSWRPFASIVTELDANVWALRLFEVDNYTILTELDLNKQHTTAILNEFTFGRQNAR
jgi:hypothetical protein